MTAGLVERWSFRRRAGLLGLGLDVYQTGSYYIATATGFVFFILVHAIAFIVVQLRVYKRTVISKVLKELT